jgi:hypothetical protein
MGMRLDARISDNLRRSPGRAIKMSQQAPLKLIDNRAAEERDG